SSRRRHTRWPRDWSSDVCSSDLAVLGDMLELGEGSVRIHRDLGEELARQGTDYLLTVGDLAAEIAAGARGAGMPADHVIMAQEQIGRASCRERVESAVVGWS